MNQWLALMPEALLSIGILYFCLNPLVKQQNTMNRVDFCFLVTALVTIGLYRKAASYLEPGIILGVLFLLAIGARLWFAKKNRVGIVLFNVSKRDFEPMKKYLNESATKAGISPSDVVYNPKRSYLVIFKTPKQAAVKSVLKAVEPYIHDHVKFSFWSFYLSMFVGLIILAIIWRF